MLVSDYWSRLYGWGGWASKRKAVGDSVEAGINRLKGRFGYRNKIGRGALEVHIISIIVHGQCHALMVGDGAVSHKRDYNTIF